MNTHAEKDAINGISVSADVASRMPDSRHSLLQTRIGRPNAIAQRQLGEMLNGSPRISQLKALRDSVDKGTARRQSLQLRATPLDGGITLIQRKIDEKNKAYIGCSVMWQGKEGKITAVQGINYMVVFGKQKPRKVPAAELDFVPDQQLSVDLQSQSDGSEARESATSLDSPSDLSGPVPAVLRLQQTRKTWTLTLLDTNGQELTKLEDVNQNQVKDYVERSKRITKIQVSSLKPGDYEMVENPELRGSLEHAYSKASLARKRNAELEKFAEQRLSSPGEDRDQVGPDQGSLMTRLWELERNRINPKTGHPAITMTKIALDRPVKLMVGGKERDITYLYTQPGNKTEIRCYLGNSFGAYQRVHTSLTADQQTMTAHTMVQTGGQVAVPQIRDRGTRVGFDSEEMPGKGFGARKLTIRSRAQCNVKDWIQGEDWERLSPDQKKACLLLAQRFNEVLDKVCLDVNRGEASQRSVTGIEPGFQILDDSWLFDNDRPATPEEELRHDEARLQTAVVEEETSDRRSVSSAPVLHPVDREQYKRQIDFIRSGLDEPGQQDGVNGMIYPGYLLTEPQITRLGDRQLIPTVPDGDCSINAVLESMGRDDEVSEIRARIANEAITSGVANEHRAAKMLQPGHWKYSDRMLVILSQLLSVRILIIGDNGDPEATVGPAEPNNGEITLFHVEGVIGHYYGSR